MWLNLGKSNIPEISLYSASHVYNGCATGFLKLKLNSELQRFAINSANNEFLCNTAINSANIEVLYTNTHNRMGIFADLVTNGNWQY